VDRRQNRDIADTLQLREVVTATTFWLPIGYDFGFMITSDMLFDSRGEFLRPSYPLKT